MSQTPLLEQRPMVLERSRNQFRKLLSAAKITIHEIHEIQPPTAPAVLLLGSSPRDRCTSAAPTITVHADQPGAKINPAMWGVFFEDINFGADGGLYAELVKNRGFEFPDPLMGWIKISPSLANGDLSVRDDAPFDANNPHYVRIESENQRAVRHFQ